MDTQTLMASLASAASYEVMQADLSSVTERITVDMVTRKITTDNSKFGNDHDHLAKTKVLDITRYVGDMDLATQTAVLHWENGTNGGVYALTEVDLSEDGRMLYKWPLSEEFTQNVGAITFAVHLYTIKTGVLLYHISSDPYDGKIGKTFSATSHALETTPPSQIEEFIQQMKDISAEIDATVAAAEAAATRVEEAEAAATRAEEAAANFEVDDTLRVPGKAADAAATGAKLSQLSSEIKEIIENASVEIPDNLVYWEEDETVGSDDFDTAIDNAIMSLEFDVTEDGLLGLYYKGNLVTSASVGGGSIDIVKCTSIALDKTELSLEYADTTTTVLTATVEPFDCTQTVKWHSSNTDVATVLDGEITVIGEGTTIITAKCGNHSATCEITITKTNITGISIGYGSSWIYQNNSRIVSGHPARAYTMYNNKNDGIPVEPSTTYIITLANTNYYFGPQTYTADGARVDDFGWKNGSYEFTASDTVTELCINFKYQSAGSQYFDAEMAKEIEDALTVRKVV